MKIEKIVIYRKVFVFFYLLTLINMKNSLVFGSFSITPMIYVGVILSFIVFNVDLIVSKKANGLVLFSYLFVICLIPSVLTSEFLLVSVVKFIPFSLGFISFSILGYQLSLALKRDKEKLLRTIILINRFVILASLVIYFIGLGFPRNATGFAGFFNHPQSFGVFLVFFILLEIMLLRIINDKYSYVFISTMIVMSYMTESRLSLGASLIVIVTYMFIFSKANIMKKVYISALLTLLVTPLLQDIYSVASDVITKRGRSQSEGIESLADSRFIFVEASIKNFIDKPISGIGFQVSNGKYGHYQMDTTKSSLFDLPLNASIEKGVFWPSLAEETGVIGFLGFMAFMIFLVMSNRSGMTNISILALFLVGTGEAFLFSFGGLGSYVWLVLFFIYSNKDYEYCEDEILH